MKHELASAGQLAQVAEALPHRKLTVDSMSRDRHSLWPADIALFLRFPSSKRGKLISEIALWEGAGAQPTSAKRDWERQEANNEKDQKDKD